MNEKPKTKQIPIHVWKEQIWNFLLGYNSDNGYSPTLWEIADGLEFKVGRKVTGERIRQVLKEMEKDGLITIGKHEWRGIHIVENPNRKTLMDPTVNPDEVEEEDDEDKEDLLTMLP